MLQEQTLSIEELKNSYFSQLFGEIIYIYKKQDFGIINFFYKIIFDKTYYQLTRIAKYSEVELNYAIAKMLLYPIDGIQIKNTNQVISLIPLFLMFVIGQKLNINYCIKLECENEWDFFLTAVAKTINHEEDRAYEYLEMFHQKLEMQSKQSLAFDLEKTMNLIGSYTKGEKLLKLLNLMFYQDCSIFAVSSQKSQDHYVRFQAQKKFEIIINTFEFIQLKHQKEIENTIEESKMKVAISFLTNDYNYDYLTVKFDHLQAGILIFSLIQLDYKQFQNFFSLKHPSLQEQLLDQIMIIAGSTDKFFFNLILVGKCLSKLRLWEYALDFFHKLYKQISNHLHKEKFRVYIYFKMCKIQFLQGQIQGLLKKFIYLGDLMQQYQEKNVEFYQPSNRNLYNSCLFLQLLISAYTKQIDKLKHITIKISTLHLVSNHQHSQKRPFNLLQYEFFRLVQQQGVIFQEKEGINQLEHILQVMQKCCKQRHNIESKKQSLLNNLISIFDSTNKKTSKLIEIDCYYRAIEEFLIINVLVRHREIYILQYLNPNFYPLLRIFLGEKDFFNRQLKSQIYFFIHDFKQAYKIAIETNNHKMIGQVLEYWCQYSDAIENYKKDISPSCFFNCAMLQKIQSDKSSLERGSLDKSGFEKVQQQQAQQNAINSFRNLAQSQNQYRMIAQMFQQVLLRRQNQYQVTENMEGELEYVNTIDLDPRLTQSTKLMNSNSKQDQLEDQSIQSGEYSTKFRSENSRITGQCKIVQSQIADNIESETSSVLEQLSNEENILLRMQVNFNFPVRKDIEFFYLNLKSDIISQEDGHLEKTLDEFVKKTQFLKYESSELFNDNNLRENIGKGGNSEVYKFYFQGQEYAAKIIQFEYKGQGETINDDEKLEIQNKLLEICIVCDVTISKIKYCLRIEHLGFKFEKLQGQIKVYKIILITKFYNNYHQVLKWEEIDKIKYVYKLSLGLATLQFDKELLHLDLKPDNVLVDPIKKNPVLADFGLSQYSQASYYLTTGVKQMTIKYIDPDLVDKSYQSRKNDVYSFGVSLFQYFSGSIPFKELNYQQVQGKIREFQSHHKNIISEIKNDLIKNLILDCTKPFQQRITFILVLKRLFFYLQQINNPKIKQLIEMMFDLIEIQQNKRKIKNLYAYLKIMKRFIKHTNYFEPLKIENKVLQSYIIVISNDSGKSFSEIIQRMKQFINWKILNKHDFILRLIDFTIDINQINQDEATVTFHFWVEDAQKIEQNKLSQWKPFFKEIATILEQIHFSQICLLHIPLSQIYEMNGKIKLNCLDYSQNLKIDQNYLYDLDCQSIDPQIKQSKKFHQLNDAYALCILIEETIKSIKQLLDQNEQDQISNLENYIEQEKEGISLQQIIDKLQN
ncbi:unnamed protein product (macronuclear) [Paramecium tetraurelia]|uniref:Protein kinase domain-containing protein n=1 Tax=Paramecium tetraurelia TaxID=5888 RepID=A0C1E7_PARTE|nr:uncharacterized protein GSPATT00034090001 [Paramecium tetraurelia]CAK64614.1 unnamed protein product [Paramecium tetraurelia]|eukprot:XP_001432012.1 hypothetical protein (macronuclear) [Paramecium tetraurelia strain d4-2]